MDEKEPYTTPPGVDERIIKDPRGFSKEAVESLSEHGINFHNWRGFQTLVGRGFSNDYYNLLQNRRNNNESIIGIVTAGPGKGKTYHALRMAELFDDKFDVNLQVCFTREQILHLIGRNSPLKRGQIIIVDEAHFGLGARTWFEDVQKMLMNSIAAIRSKGFMILIVCLHLDMMDKVIRKYVLSFMHHMEKRGTATIYRLFTPRFEKEMRKKRLCQVKLMLPGYEGCTHTDCLECDYRGTCNSSRGIYERNKKAFIEMKTAEAEAKIKSKEGIPSKHELLPMVMEYKEKFSFTNRGTPHWSSIQDIVYEEFGYDIGRSLCMGLVDSIMRKHRGEIAQLVKERKDAETT